MAKSELARAGQSDLTRFRQQTGRGAAWLTSGRLVVLPDWLMDRLGGAAAIYCWICISPRILAAPDQVRRAVIAHEWGHAVSGHCLAMMAAIVSAVIYAAVTLAAPAGSIGVGIFAIGLLGSMTILMLWALGGKREFEADAVAVELVGAADLAQALRWVVTNMRSGVQTDSIAERLRQLEDNRVRRPIQIIARKMQ
jgi:peptidase M48-like protein